MHLVDIDCRVDGSYLRVHLASGVLHPQRKAVGDGLNHLVKVHMLLLQHGRLLLVHAHLQDLLDKEPQALALVKDYSAEVVEH